MAKKKEVTIISDLPYVADAPLPTKRIRSGVSTIRLLNGKVDVMDDGLHFVCSCLREVFVSKESLNKIQDMLNEVSDTTKGIAIIAYKEVSFPELKSGELFFFSKPVSGYSIDKQYVKVNTSYMIDVSTDLSNPPLLNQPPVNTRLLLVVKANKIAYSSMPLTYIGGIIVDDTLEVADAPKV